MRVQLTITAVLVLWATACNSSSSSGASASEGGAGGGGDGGGSSGGDSGCVTGGPAVQSVPTGWARPSDCGGVGDYCIGLLTCGSRSECQALGNYCVPSAGPNGLGADCPQTPYCLGYSCMDYDQASCFCTGEAGVDMFPSCSCGPAAVTGLCAGEGASCKTTACCNCQSLKCVTDSVLGTTLCRQPCTKDSDCATSCCNTASGYCQDSSYCTCLADGGTGCGGSGPSCCPGNTCLTFNSDGGGPFRCYQDCTQQSQCPAGTQCSQTITGLNHGACGP